MSTMVQTAVTEGSFTEVASGTARAFLQLQTRGSVVVYVGSSAPANSSRVGVKLENGEIEEVAFDHLETGDRVFVRSLFGNATLLVMTSDAAPA